LPLLDFSSIAEEKKQDHFAGVQAGLDKNYALLERSPCGEAQRNPGEVLRYCLRAAPDCGLRPPSGLRVEKYSRADVRQMIELI
jgi:hypothetical protein